MLTFIYWGCAYVRPCFNYRNCNRKPRKKTFSNLLAPQTPLTRRGSFILILLSNIRTHCVYVYVCGQIYSTHNARAQMTDGFSFGGHFFYEYSIDLNPKLEYESFGGRDFSKVKHKQTETNWTTRRSPRKPRYTLWSVRFGSMPVPVSTTACGN